MDCERLIDDNRVWISLIACSMNYETAVTFTRGHFNKVVFAVTLFAHALNRHGIPWRLCSYMYVRILVTS